MKVPDKPREVICAGPQEQWGELSVLLSDMTEHPSPALLSTLGAAPLTALRCSILRYKEKFRISGMAKQGEGRILSSHWHGTMFII